MRSFYEGDSLFTLPGWAQAGLVLVSLVMVAGLLAVLHAVARRLPGRRPARAALRLGLAYGGLVVFLWLSPQVYYFYYQAAIGGLPWQIAIGWPEPGAALRLMAFAGRETLADHARGALGWSLVLWAVLPSLGWWR